MWGKKCKSYISSKSEPDHAHGNYGSVWIQLIFAENWKYCNKIIFKCMNSTVKSFLMKKLLKSEVCGSHEQCTRPTNVHSTTYFAANSAWVDEKWTVNRLKSQKQGQEEKKKKKKETQKCKRKNYKLYPNPHYMSTTCLCWFDSIEGADAGMAIEKMRFRLVSMFLVSVMDDLYILYERKH